MCHYLAWVGKPHNKPRRLLYEFNKKIFGQHTIIDQTQHHSLIP